MLNAVFSGKKRGTGLQSQRTAIELASGAEDVLTASVFERLAYLPEALLSAILSEVLGVSFGALEVIEFWPSWYLDKDKRVEPDLLLDDGHYHVLVEAKRHDHVRQQLPDQLANELLAGWRENYLDDNCILLALGGLEDSGEVGRQRLLGEVLRLLPVDSEARFKLVCCSWQQLYQTIEAHINPKAPLGCQRLLDDIAKSYAWHGLRTHPMRWLGNLLPARLNLHAGVFDAWSIE